MERNRRQGLKMYSNYLLMLHGEINRPRFVSEKILCLTKELWHTYYVMTYMYIVNWGRNLSLSSKSVCRSNQNKLDHIKCKLTSYCSILIGQDMANLLLNACPSIVIILLPELLFCPFWSWWRWWGRPGWIPTHCLSCRCSILCCSISRRVCLAQIWSIHIFLIDA